MMPTILIRHTTYDIYAYFSYLIYISLIILLFDTHIIFILYPAQHQILERLTARNLPYSYIDARCRSRVVYAKPSKQGLIHAIPRMICNGVATKCMTP